MAKEQQQNQQQDQQQSRSYLDQAMDKLKAVGNFPQRNVENAPSFTGQMEALWRDMRNNAGDKLNEVFFGQRDGMSGPGTPNNPTQYTVNQQMGTAGQENIVDYYASRGSVHGDQQQKGMSR